MIWLFILCFVGAVVCLVLATVDNVWNGFFYGLWFTGCVLIAFGSVIITKSEPVPNAIDVYRGRTTLKISYEDNVPIDTVVVFKNEYIKSLSHE